MIIGCRLGNVSLPTFPVPCSLLSVPCLRPSSIRNRIRVQFQFRNWNFMHSQEAVRQWGEWLEILTRNWSIWWRGKTTLESLTICVGNSIYVSEILINLPARRVSLGVSLSPPFPASSSSLSLSLFMSLCLYINYQSLNVPQIESHLDFTRL